MSFREQRRQANREARRSYDSGSDSDSSGSSDSDDDSSSSSSGSSSDSSQSYREERRQANREAASGGSSGSSGSSDDPPEDNTPPGMPGNPDRTDSDSGSSGSSGGSSDSSDQTPDGLPGSTDRRQETESDSGTDTPEDQTPTGMPGSTERRQVADPVVDDGVDTDAPGTRRGYDTSGGPENLDAEQRRLVEESIDSQMDSQAGRDLERGEDYTVQATERGFGATPTDQFYREQARHEREQAIESRTPEEGDVLEGTPGWVRDAGRTILGEEAPDQDITGSLSEGDGSIPFTLTDEERAKAQEGAQNYRDFFGVGEEAEQFTMDLTGSETAASFAGGLGQATGDLGAVVREGPLLVDTTIKGAANLPGTAQEYGAVDTGEAVANTIFSTARGGVEEFDDNPVQTGGRVAGGFAAGAAVTRGASSARTGIRSGRVRVRSDSTVDLEDITSEKGVQGESPTFDTDPDAPTSEAVDELDTRAADNPDAAAPGDSDRAVFHTTGADISQSRGARNRVRDAADRVTPGQSADIDVGEGGSELPGLWASPDASPLGLEMGGRGSSFSAALTRPRLRGGKSDQVVSLPGDDIRAMPDDATGSGYELRNPDGTVEERGLGRGQAKSRAEGTDLEVAPDSSTQGYEFLSEQAEPGAIYARPQGARTSELEGIAPPGSRYVEEGMTAVRMPGRTLPGTDVRIPGTGRTIPMRRFERMDSDGDGPDTSTADVDGDTTPESGGEPMTAYELPSSRSRDVTPGQQAAAGGYLGSGASIASGDGSTTTGPTTTGTETTSPTPTTSTTTFSSPTSPTGSSGGSTSSSPTSPSGSGSGSGSPGGSGGTPTSGGGTSIGGSSGGPGSPSGSGGTPFYPTDPTTPNRPMDIDLGSDESGRTPRRRSGGKSEGYTTDFSNPLTGETLETDSDSSDEESFPGLGF